MHSYLPVHSVAAPDFVSGTSNERSGKNQSGQERVGLSCSASQRKIEEENVSKQYVTGVSICVFPARQRAIALPIFCAADCPLFHVAGAIVRR